jgi:hypothetical protein
MTNPTNQLSKPKVRPAAAALARALAHYGHRARTAMASIRRPVVGWNPWLERVTNG